MKRNPKVLSVDIGGTGVKILATGQTERRRFASGRKMTPESMVAQPLDPGGHCVSLGINAENLAGLPPVLGSGQGIFHG